jgi:hypothetical protein
VPLTDAVISYSRGSAYIGDEIPTLLINRSLASSIRAATEARAPILPWEGSGAPRVGAPGALDLTSDVHQEPAEGK